VISQDIGDTPNPRWVRGVRGCGPGGRAGERKIPRLDRDEPGHLGEDIDSLPSPDDP
jgi:hypothetical protein